MPGISNATKHRHEVIIERGLDQMGVAGDFKLANNGDYGPELRAAAKNRYQVLLFDSRVIGHNGSETLLLCAIQSMVQNFIIGYRACLVAHKLPPLT